MTNHIDISYSLINDMLGISCLIYDCNKELKFKKNNNYYDINHWILVVLIFQPCEKKYYLIY